MRTESRLSQMRLASLRQRLPQALGVSGRDLVIALLLAGLGAADALHGGWRGPPGVNVVVVSAMALSLAWRRRQPTGMLAAVMGGMVLLSFAFGGSETATAVFIPVVAVYSAAAHARDSRLPPVVLLAAVGAAVHDLRDPLIASFGDAIWTTLMWGLSFLVGLGMRSRQAQTRLLEAEAQSLRDRQRLVAVEAAEAERQRIARELHDILSHSLSVVVLQAGAAEQVLDQDREGVRAALQSIRSTGLAAVGEMATLLALARGEGRPSLQPQPSLSDLDALVATTRDAGLHVDFAMEGPRRDLPAAVEVSAFRIVQEALTNALKHAGSGSAQVTVRFEPSTLELEVSNEGGEIPEIGGSGRGLLGIGERVQVLGGRFEAGPLAGGGWVLRAILPVAQ